MKKDILRLRYELNGLRNILDNTNWDQQGWGLFSNHVPDGVEWLRKHVPDNIMAINDRNTLLNLAKHIKQHTFSSQHSSQAPITTKLYKIAKNIGKNDLSEFQNLGILIKSFPGTDAQVTAEIRVC